MNCSSLTTFIIPKGVTCIEYQTFDNCSGLTSITIPSNVTSIGRGAFHGCSRLTDVYYGGSESQWKQISIDSSAYSTGAYTDEHGNAPLFSAKIHYNSAASSTPSFKIERSAQNLTVNGVKKDCDKYNIDGSNYFKLRDLAYMLSGTGSQFAVGYDDATKTVTVNKGAPYTPNGSEMVIGEDKSATAEPSGQTIMIDGQPRGDLTVYNIGGNNYFKLRDLGTALGFNVDYDEATKTAIVNSK